MTINNSFGVDNLTFLEQVFADLQDGSTPVVCAFPESATERETKGMGWAVSHPLGNPCTNGHADELNTYFCIAAVRIQAKLSRAVDNLAALHVFVLDDVGTGAGAKVAPDKVPLAPSYVIETSLDNYQYGYLLRVPLTDIGEAQALVKAMTPGHGDEGGKIIAKLVRLPIGYNNKPNRLHDGAPFPVMLTEWNPERRYTVEQLLSAFKVSRDALEQAKRTDERRTLRTQTGIEDEIWRWLKTTERCSGAVDSAGFVTIECPWADTHTSGTQARYSPYGYGGRYQFQRQFVCFHEHCKSRTTGDFLNWVRANGGPDLNAHQLSRFVERYVLIEQGSTVRDLERPGVRLQLQEFHAVHANRGYLGGASGKQRKFFSKDWQEHPSRQTAATETFGPDLPTLFVDPQGVARFNTWRPANVIDPTDNEDLLPPILAHLRYLFPLDADYTHALGFLAATVHLPHLRIQHALLHISQHHGTGRGLMKQLLAALLPGYVRSAPSLEQVMKGAFNEFLYQSLLVVFDEIYNPGTRFAVKDRLRELITETRLQINIKHGFKGEADIYANIMFFSNHYAAMSISKEDRRIWVVVNDAPPLSIEHYSEMFKRVRDPETVRQMYWYLHRWLDAHPFDCGARAPRGVGRSLMRRTEDDDFGAEVVRLLAKLRLLGVDVIYRGQFVALLALQGVHLPPTTFGPPSLEHKRLRAILIDNNVLPAGRGRVTRELMANLPRGESDRQYIYTIGNPTQYSNERIVNLAALNTLGMTSLRGKRDDDNDFFTNGAEKSQ